MSDLLYFETKLKLELVFLKSKTLEDSFSIFYNLMLIMETYVCYPNVSRDMYICD